MQVREDNNPFSRAVGAAAALRRRGEKEEDEEEAKPAAPADGGGLLGGIRASAANLEKELERLQIGSDERPK